MRPNLVPKALADRVEQRQRQSRRPALTVAKTKVPQMALDDESPIAASDRNLGRDGRVANEFRIALGKAGALFAELISE
jgi:hypothetical protein